MSLLFFPVNYIISQEGEKKNQEDIVKENIIKDGLKGFFKNDTSIVSNSYEKLLNLYKENKDSSILAKHYQYKAMYFQLKYLNDSSYFYYNKSKNISKFLGDSLEVGRRLLSLAVIQRNVKDFLGSEISLVEALEYLEPIHANKYLEISYNSLGLVSDDLERDKEALDYYNKALVFNEIVKNDVGYLYLLNNIGLVYQQEEKHEEASSYFRKGLEHDSIKEKYPNQYALLLENLTYSGFKLGKKESILEHFEEVLRIREKQNNLQSLSTTHLNISNYYIDKNEKKAKFHANEALEYAKQTSNNKRWLEALKTLSDLSTGNQSKAYLEEYIQLNDSLFQQERQLKNQFAKIRYETDKTEKENEDLKIENEKTLAEAELQKQRATIGLLLSGISIMFLLSSISFFRFRRKKLLFQSQLQKIEAREQERRQIAKSLHDEVAGDLRLLHRKLEKSFLLEEAQKLELVKDNVRNLSHQLSSVSFEDVPFRDQILNLVSDYFSPDFIIKVNGLKEIDWSEANKSIKRLLYLSLRECIQNCQKYAEASKMTINFSIHKKSVFLDVADNGKGFDTATQKKGIGLLNLQERVQDLNGTLTIESEVGKGTKIIIQTPLNA
ncbi:tetratricopeptide repeat protein [Tenacibaculum sp. 190524A05c]|uniref:tetratricopeptide repeat-containing sensor histidine kinase n=1 Tax=Tenacibaculum platacis TaxID=3137852 RepID=UPI0032B1623B